MDNATLINREKGLRSLARIIAQQYLEDRLRRSPLADFLSRLFPLQNGLLLSPWTIQNPALCFYLFGFVPLRLGEWSYAIPTLSGEGGDDLGQGSVLTSDTHAF